MPRRIYRWTHLIGCAICIAGIIVNTISDLEHNDEVTVDDTNQDNPQDVISPSAHIKGDVFAIIGAVLLGLDDVLSEMVMDFGGVVEMLFMKGTFGALISIIQMSILERDSVATLFSTSDGTCEFEWRMILFVMHVITRGLDIAGEMTFLYVSEAGKHSLVYFSFYYIFLFLIHTSMTSTTSPSTAQYPPTHI